MRRVVNASGSVKSEEFGRRSENGIYDACAILSVWTMKDLGRDCVPSLMRTLDAAVGIISGIALSPRHSSSEQTWQVEVEKANAQRR